MSRFGSLRRGYTIGRAAQRYAARAALAMAFFTLGLCMAAPRVDPRDPRVVGHGCVGSRGPLYAAEEDHLPRCANVERWR